MRDHLFQCVHSDYRVPGAVCPLMGTPYQESYGEDRIVIDGDGNFNRRMWYDWEDHTWRCRCEAYMNSGSCKHAYRYRRQYTIQVNEEYL